jgi:hypothetical protein
LQRRDRDLGGPSVRAVFGGYLMLIASLHTAFLSLSAVLCFTDRTQGLRYRHELGRRRLAYAFPYGPLMRVKAGSFLLGRMGEPGVPVAGA